MKQEKIIGITFAALGAALIVLCGILYLKADRTAPVIGFQAVDTIYREEMEEAEILEGAEAYDSVDGDVTERIVIEKIIEDREEGRAVVFYAVSDAAGNVAKASRMFQAVFDESGEGTGRAAEGLMEAGITAELGSVQKEEGEEDNPEAENAPGEEDDFEAEDDLGKEDNSEAEDDTGREDDGRWEEDSGQEETEDDVISQAEVSPPVNTPAPSSRQGTADSREPAAEQETETEGQSEKVSAPTLELKVSEVRVKAGQGPAWVDIISTLWDDEDNYETLFRNLNVDSYDRNKPGTYQVGVRTVDSDGNSSGTVPLTIIVE